MAYDEKRYPAPRVYAGEDALDASNVRRNIQAAIDLTEEQIDVTLKVIAALRPWDGKKMDRRVQAAVEKLIPNYVISYQKEGYPFNRIQLHIWSKRPDSLIDHGNRIMLTLTRDGNVFDLGAFESGEASRYLRSDTVAELQAALDDLDERVKVYNETLPKWREALAGLGPVYQDAFHYRRY